MLFPVGVNDNSGYINKSGKLVIPPLSPNCPLMGQWRKFLPLLFLCGPLPLQLFQQFIL